MDEKRILIIIPTLNEGQILGKVISDLNKYFINHNILVIYAYSSDETYNEVKKKKC